MKFRQIRKFPVLSTILFLMSSWLVISFFVYKFESVATGANINSYGDSLWWGIVTFLTVGYGDKYPITPEGRILAQALMVIGVLCISIVTAKFSSVFLEKTLRERKGQVNSDELKNHFIICGWKHDMHVLLLHILSSNPGLSSDKIVLVNRVPDTSIEELMSYPQLKKIKIISGEFYSLEVLQRAVPQKAKKILILADATVNEKGQMPTRTEADARTIMTAMTLSNIAKGVPVAAEILENHMDQYLKLAQVHEIIYSRDYSRLLLAMASTGTGVTNIFHDLLDPKSAYFISTEMIDSKLISLKYQDLKNEYEKRGSHEVLIGILENSGNAHQAKELALKKAQQTPNVKELVENLNTVKNLKFNRPILNPPMDYQLGETCMAIVIKSKEIHESHRPEFT